MDDERIVGRTPQGTSEISQKSGRLTQTERLVLIVVGAQVSVAALLKKLPTLSTERVEHALVRLLELGLIYEVLAPQPEADSVKPAPIPVPEMRAFLAQSDSDPVTIIATPEMLQQTAKIRALNAAIDQVIADAGTQIQDGKSGQKVRSASSPAAPIAVPLSKIFPQRNAIQGDLPNADEADRVSDELKVLRERANEQIRSLESALANKRSSGSSSGARPNAKRRSRERTVARHSEGATSSSKRRDGGLFGIDSFGWLAIVSIIVAMAIAVLAKIFA